MCGSLLVLSACSNTQVANPLPDETAPSNFAEDKATEAGNETGDETRDETELIVSLNTLISQGGGARENFKYIQDHIDQASPQEADQMIEILLIMQTPFIQKAYEGIFYEEGYMTALNETMGGILDESKVDQIKDETIRSFYQSLIKSALTIVRYEETPSVETDWAKIKSLNGQYTSLFQMVVDMSDYQEYLRNQDLKTLTDRIYQMEDKLSQAEDSSDFARASLENLYDLYVGSVLVGPEGTYLYQLNDPKDDYAIQMKAVIEGHDNSGFFQIANQLMQAKINQEAFNPLIEMVNAYQRNNPYQTFNWHLSKTLEGTAENNLLSLESANKALEEKINEGLRHEADEMLREADVKGDYNLTMYKTYESYDAVSIAFYLNYTDENNQAVFLEKVVSYSLKTGEVLTLSKLLECDKAEVIDLINQGSQSNYTQLPRFELTKTGILLRAQSTEEATAKHSVMTSDQLYRRNLELQ